MAGFARLSEEQLRALDRLTPLSQALGLYLAGGTAIAVHLGHRVSRDIDLFTRKAETDLETARKRFVEISGAEVDSLTDAALRGRVGSVPVDVVNYPSPPLNPTVQGPGGFAVASLEDLAVMKIAAIARRGIRRDFWDLREILTSGQLTLEQSLASYTRRYGVRESELYHVLRSLTYFEDAEADPLLPEGLSTDRWMTVRQFFVEGVPPVFRRYLGSDG
jgi:hypothetical protein